jgi:hypothetical protein
MIELLGKKPVNEQGQRFAATHFEWPIIWDMCHAIAPTVINDYNAYFGKYNDGGVSFREDQALKLAGFLELHMESGQTEKDIKNIHDTIESLKGEQCTNCEGTKKERNQLTGEMVRCNTCGGTGRFDNLQKRIVIEIEYLKKLSIFLRNCGGFSVV